MGERGAGRGVVGEGSGLFGVDGRRFWMWMFWGMGREGRGGGGSDVPGLRNDDVVEGGIAFTEAGEADFDDHCLVSGGRERGGFRFTSRRPEFDRAEVVFFRGG